MQFQGVTDQLGAQGTVCAGGRYDGLVEQIGGKSAPACGFAMGVERLLALMDQQDSAEAQFNPDCYIVHQGENTRDYAWKCAEFLRDKGLDVVLHCGGGNFKTQMKKADTSGAYYALIIGDEEVKTNQITVKSLRRISEQARLNLDDVVRFIKQ